jgi:hypothetical protein
VAPYTNTKGCDRMRGAMLTGKIPYWDYHLCVIRASLPSKSIQ